MGVGVCEIMGGNGSGWAGVGVDMGGWCGKIMSVYLQ